MIDFHPTLICDCGCGVNLFFEVCAHAVTVTKKPAHQQTDKDGFLIGQSYLDWKAANPESALMWESSTAFAKRAEARFYSRRN